MAKPPNKNTLILSLQFSGDQQSIHYIKTLNGSLVGALNQISLLNEHTLARKSTLRLQLDLESVSKRPGLGFVFACGAVADVELPSVLKQEGIYFRIKFDDMYNLVLHNCLGESMKMSYYDWRRRIDSPDFTLQESIIGGRLFQYDYLESVTIKFDSGDLTIKIVPPSLSDIQNRLKPESPLHPPTREVIQFRTTSRNYDPFSRKERGIEYIDVGRPYVECEELGSGGFGKVDKVFDPQTGELFARKTLLKADRDSSRSISDAKAMLAEINMHAKLKHPTITSMDHAVHSHLEPRMFLEVSVYGNVYTHIAESTRWPSQICMTYAITLLIQCLDGLQFLHEKKGTIHFDIKPQNILVFREDPLLFKLADFGTSKRKTPGLYSSAGTPKYTPPEWDWDGQPENSYPTIIIKKYRTSEPIELNEKVDIWALGIIILEMVHESVWNRREEGNRKAFFKKVATILKKRKLLRHLEGDQAEKDRALKLMDILRDHMLQQLPLERSSASKCLKISKEVFEEELQQEIVIDKRIRDLIDDLPALSKQQKRPHSTETRRTAPKKAKEDGDGRQSEWDSYEAILGPTVPELELPTPSPSTVSPPLSYKRVFNGVNLRDESGMSGLSDTTQT